MICYRFRMVLWSTGAQRDGCKGAARPLQHDFVCRSSIHLPSPPDQVLLIYQVNISRYLNQEGFNFIIYNITYSFEKLSIFQFRVERQSGFHVVIT